MNKIEAYFKEKSYTRLNKKEVKVLFNIMRELYAKAEPKTSFDALCNNGVTAIPDFFMYYYLSSEEQDEIIAKHLKRVRLETWIKGRIRNTVYMGCSPNSSRQRWSELRGSNR